MRVYISGAVTGFNRNSVQKRFRKVELQLKNHGYTSFNPANIDHPSWDAAMRECIIQLMKCDNIYMLDGWEKSKGACIERQLAGEVNIPVFYECDDDLGLKNKRIDG